MNEGRLLCPLCIYNKCEKITPLEANAPCSSECSQTQKAQGKKLPVFLRGSVTVCMQFAWLWQEKTKFRYHIQVRDFNKYLKQYYPTEFRWEKNYHFLIRYIFTPLPIVQKFKVQMFLLILFLTPLSLTGGRHKAGGQPRFTDRTWNCTDYVSIANKRICW